MHGSLEESITAHVLIWQERCVLFSIMCRSLHWKTFLERWTIWASTQGQELISANWGSLEDKKIVTHGTKNGTQLMEVRFSSTAATVHFDSI